VAYEPEPNERGERLIWLEDAMADRLRYSSLVDWPVYPRLSRTMQGSERPRNSGRRNPSLRPSPASRPATPTPHRSRGAAICQTNFAPANLSLSDGGRVGE
jgi:hypothetical protein